MKNELADLVAWLNQPLCNIHTAGPAVLPCGSIPILLVPCAEGQLVFPYS